MLKTIFGERFALTHSVPLGPTGGGTLLDLSSGAYFTLNCSGAEIWLEYLKGGRVEDISRLISRRFDVPTKEAHNAVLNVISSVETSIAAGVVVVDWPDLKETPYSIRSTGGRHEFLVESQSLFTFDPTTLLLERTAELGESGWRMHLWPLSPNLLAMLGVPVLHAAALATECGVKLLSGPSGAGKTTTASSWASNGVTQTICEDKAVLSFDDGTPRVVLRGEEVIREWVDRAAGALTHHTAIEVRELLSASEGVSLPVSEILFLHEGQRRGLHVEVEFLERSAAVSVILQQTFTGRSDTEDWRFRFSWVSQLAAYASVGKMFVPQGTQHLAQSINQWELDGRNRLHQSRK